MIIIPSYWVVMGIIYLLILTYQDYKNKMVVDDRKNYLMLGATIALISHFKVGLIYMLILLSIIIFIGWLFNKYKTLGKADINSLRWLFLGFGIISIYYLLAFLVIFTLLYILYWGLKKIIFRLTNHLNISTQFYGVILFSYILTLVMLSLILP